MDEIIKINTNERGEVNVSARELYQALEVRKSYRFNQWFETNAKQLIEDEDYRCVDITTQQNQYGGIKTIQDYSLTVDAAKQIAMMSGTEKGKQVRMYFIEVERAWNSPDQIMARALQISKLKLESKDKLIAEMKPKALFADAVDTSENSILVGQLAKLLRQNGVDIGQNRLFTWLRDHEYLGVRGEQRNLPTQKSMDLEVMETKTRTVNNPDGSVRTTNTPKVTGKGQIYFVNKFLQEKGDVA
ncbi:phage antirepressor KilAC domain-containing protein [Leuconostoc citreum]